MNKLEVFTMPRYTTLTDYVNTQIEKFDIPDTEKNRSKLRIKFTRELKRLGYWDTAEKKVIGRNETRLFSDEQLILLYLHFLALIDKVQLQ